MARALRKPRRAKEPPAPVVYELSPEIDVVMHRLIRLNPVQFGWVNNFKLGCVIVRGSRPKEQGGCVVLARFVKVPPLWHGLTGYDAIIRVEEWAWSRLDAAGQEALVAHELCHGSMSEKGSLRVMKHDLEEFGFVVRKYGAWTEGIALFDKQLAMFEPGLGAPDRGEQTPAFGQGVTSIEERRRARTEGVGSQAAHLDGDEDVPRETPDPGPEPEALDLGGCPFPGCVLAAEHEGAHLIPPPAADVDDDLLPF